MPRCLFFFFAVFKLVVFSVQDVEHCNNLLFFFRGCGFWIIGCRGTTLFFRLQNWTSLCRMSRTLLSSPPLADWEAPTFTRAAQFRVGATLVLFLFAAVSNLALLISVCHGRGRRLASHLRPLITSLAAADLVMTFIVMPLDMVWNVTVQWHGGDGLCKFLSFLKLFAMQASAFILVVISLDRHHAILHPLDTINAHRRNKRMLVLAWSLSLLLASPQVGYSTSHIKMK